ncbi:MAG: sigma-70 family RNA polymerase sigma factor [Crenarchaeota archaeon]|nr:sigma-70 family RNA polymerase sigma factor [Thermoproteota archaeon]
MSVKLSKTEIEVGKLYFEHGKKPKEIAELLGLSINTVYKAISKYRSYMRELERERKVERGESSSREGSILKSEENREEGKDVAKELNIENENGKTMIVVEELKSRISRKVTTVLSFKAYMPLLPSSFITYESPVRSILPSSTRSDVDLVSKFVDCMLSIARELENIRDVLLKISERIENIKIVNENGNSRTVIENQSTEKRNDEYNIPSFIRDNVWVDIIKSKYANID